MNTIDEKELAKKVYEILRTNLKLSASINRDQTLKEYEKVARQLDEIYQEEYEESIAKCFYTALTLEEEVIRLEQLVSNMSIRQEQRKKLLKDYESVTNGITLSGLSPLEKEEQIEQYNARLNYIKSYLDNTKKIDSTKDDIENLTINLTKEQKTKEVNERKNLELEEELKEIFTDCIGEEINNLNLTEEENKMLQEKVSESRNTKEISLVAFNELKKSGLSEEQENDYFQTVREAITNYYHYKEQELIINMYQLVTRKEQEYPEIYSKRQLLKQLLEERDTLRKELIINDIDYLLPVYNLLLEQDLDISKEKDNINNITKNTNQIKVKEGVLEHLEEENNRVEILAILREFNIIDTYEEDEIKIEELESQPLTIPDSEPIPSIVTQDNQVQKIEDMPLQMNIGLVRLKSEAVMKKVDGKLNPIEEVKKEEVETKVEEPPILEEIPEPTELVMPEVELPVMENDVFPVIPDAVPKTSLEPSNEEPQISNNLFWNIDDVNEITNQTFINNVSNNLQATKNADQTVQDINSKTLRPML